VTSTSATNTTVPTAVAAGETVDRPAENAGRQPPRRTRRRAGRVLAWAAAAVVTVLLTYPFLWLVSASLKPRSQVFDNRLWPREWHPQNYVEVWQEAPILRWLTNSVVVGLAAATAVTLSSAFIAFGFAYFRFRGRGVLFGLVLATMMLPGTVTMVPTYLVWNELGLATTQVPLWGQNLFGSAIYIFLLRQFFLQLPRELFEAARVDGLSHLGLFWRIAVPLSKPALIITFVLELRASWTDLVRPLIYLQDSNLFTIPRGLKVVLDQFGQGGEMKWEVVLAASVIATVPMIVAFFLGQRYFVQGISTSGRKG
jgi:multiple sugar transport system permease protein